MSATDSTLHSKSVAPIVPPESVRRTLAAISPIDGSPLDEVHETPVDTLPALVAKVRGAQQAWAAKTVAERVKIVRQVADRVLDRAEEIARKVHAEVGKPETEALLGEVLPTADVVTYWTRVIEELLEPAEIEIDRFAYPGKTGFIHREARGVIALITPWNFPFALPLRTIVPALLAGNAIVFKPSEVSPRSGALIADAFRGLLPDGVLEIVQGGGGLGAALCAADVDLVVFTGSVASGRKVARACAERLVPCSLELGGKDAAIVLADANLDRAANGIVWAAMMNAGQNCAAVERVYVEKSVAPQLSEKIVFAVKALRRGDEIGPLTTAAQRAIVTRHVDDAVKQGAKLLCGGAPEGPDGGHGYAPTVVSLEMDDVDLMREETFGPVVPIVEVASADDAVTHANASKYGLTASVWTRNIAKGEAIARKLRAGVVTINNHSFTGALPQAPWSGYGDSGHGITGSPLALESLTRPRFILVDRSRGSRELWWYPYTPVLRTIALAMVTLRGGKNVFAKIGAFFALIVAFPKRMFGG